MKKEKAELWVKALRSGEFPQGVGFLENNRKLCVYGLLCVLAMVDGVCDYDLHSTLGEFDGSKGRLPTSVREWAGLPQGAISVPGEFVSLSWLNDNGWSFTELAEIIEVNYEQL